jgi:hypothetical protein
MKKMSVVCIAAALLATAQISAAEETTPADAPKAKICAQIGGLLEGRAFNLGDRDAVSATVRFILNDEKEIVVLSVDTDDARLEAYVKARLNYQKVTDRDLEEGKTYKVPIRITA